MPNRTITSNFWASSEEWSSDEKLVFLYLCTCPVSNVCGLFKITEKKIADDSNLTRENSHAALLALHERGQVVYAPPLIFIPDYSKHQHAEHLGYFKDHVFKVRDELCKNGNKASLAFADYYTTLLNPFDNALDNPLP